MKKEENYLKKELYNLIKEDSKIIEFIQTGSLDGLWYWDLENIENEWMSSRFWEVLGFNPNEKKHLASEWQDLIDSEDLKVALTNFEKHCNNPNHPYDQIVRYKHKNGSTVWIRCRGIAIRDENGKPTRMLGTHTDITEIKNLQNELEKQNQKLLEKQKEIEDLNKKLRLEATTDKLTGLLNRRHIDNMIEFEKNKSYRSQTTFSILIIDINCFKKINDRYGHLAGDCVLIDVSKNLKNLLRKQDLVSRWGGDEFLVLLPDTNESQGKIVVEKISEAVKGWKVKYGEEIIDYSISIGRAEYCKNEDINNLIKRGDLSLYKEKEFFYKVNNKSNSL